MTLLNPSISALIKVISHFKKFFKLDKINFFVSNSNDFYRFSSFKSIYSKIKTIEFIDSFQAINSDMTNELVVLKCNLEQLLKFYKKLNLSETIQNVIWIPEKSSSMKLNYDSFSGYRLFIFKWEIDFEITLLKLIEQVLHKNINGLDKKNLIENLKHNNLNDNIYSELFTSNKFRFKRISNLEQEEYFIEIKNDKITLTDCLINETVKFDLKQSTKPLYRIVSTQIEPFLIAINTDDTECKDGVRCLDLQTLYSNLVVNKLNKINMIKCCKGFITDLVQKLSFDLNFNFELMLSKNNTPKSAIDDISNEIQIAQIAAGPFRVNKTNIVDFSIPFLYSGYSILIKQSKAYDNDLFMFLKPFTYIHWIIIGLFTFASALSLALLEFNSPFGLNPKGRARIRNYTLGSGISMVMSLMFMHTMPAKSPKSWAGKWTQNFIAVFALIFIATYTAQMASILSAEQKHSIFRIKDNEVLILVIIFSN